MVRLIWEQHGTCAKRQRALRYFFSADKYCAVHYTKTVYSWPAHAVTSSCCTRQIVAVDVWYKLTCINFYAAYVDILQRGNLSVVTYSAYSAGCSTRGSCCGLASNSIAVSSLRWYSSDARNNCPTQIAALVADSVLHRSVPADAVIPCGLLCCHFVRLLVVMCA